MLLTGEIAFRILNVICLATSCERRLSLNVCSYIRRFSSLNYPFFETVLGGLIFPQ